MKKTTWTREKLIKKAWKNVFKRGLRVWASIAAACFVFSFLGVVDSAQTSFVNKIDKIVNVDNMFSSNKIEVLYEHIDEIPILNKLGVLEEDASKHILEDATDEVTWLVRVLSINSSYLERNASAVIVFLIISALISVIFNVLIKDAAVVGLRRYSIERCFSKRVSTNRILAPFQRKNIWKIVITMFKYNVTMILWWITVIGGIYKRYQYRFVPFICAENPQISWKQAKSLSMQMTKGNIWNMIKIDLKCIPVWLLKIVPVAGIFVAVPFEVQLYAEMYVQLRKNISDENRDLLIEDAFESDIYNQQENEYKLKDVVIIPERGERKSTYSLREYILFFFIFCFIGWAYEVGIYIFKSLRFINRGSMYGPWIPIYGFGGTLIILLLNRFNKNKWKVFLYAMLTCSVLEYVGSWMLDFFMNARYWNYYDKFLNVNGRICIAGLLVFGLGGLIAIYIGAPKISAFLRKISIKKQTIFCIILVILFLTDLAYCLIVGFNSGTGIGEQLSNQCMLWRNIIL